MKKLKTDIKPLKVAHTNSSPRGMGDYYGSGVKNKVGKIREVSGIVQPSKSNIGKPPKSLA